MKKTLIASALFSIVSIITHAQTVNNIPLKDIDVEYVQIIGYERLLSSKMTVELDFGQNSKFFNFGKETFIKDANGSDIRFNSIMDAVNFLAKHGYEFQQAFTVKKSDQNYWYYIMRNKKAKESK